METPPLPGNLCRCNQLSPLERDNGEHVVGNKVGSVGGDPEIGFSLIQIPLEAMSTQIHETEIDGSIRYVRVVGFSEVIERLTEIPARPNACVIGSTRPKCPSASSPSYTALRYHDSACSIFG